MAKRKRLSPAQGVEIGSEPPVLETKAFGGGHMITRAPIAQVAGDASATSALQELAEEVRQARDGGRLIQALPLDQVDVGYLVRDRMMADEEDLQVLMTSLKKRGQQTPIEVVELSGGRFGLISGWRRLTALKRLADETGEESFQAVQALIRTPESAEAAYTAMVEENEIRVGLSYYERARIAAKAVEQGVFPHERAALQELFAAASRAKRSKIGSFLRIYQAADDLLRFPTALTERLGSALARQLEDDPGTRQRLEAAFAAKPPETAEDELALLDEILAPASKNVSNIAASEPFAKPEPLPKPEALPAPLPARTAPPTPRKYSFKPGITVSVDESGIVLTGEAVSEAFSQDLGAWLRAYCKDM